MFWLVLFGAARRNSLESLDLHQMILLQFDIGRPEGEKRKKAPYRTLCLVRPYPVCDV